MFPPPLLSAGYQLWLVEKHGCLYLKMCRDCRMVRLKLVFNLNLTIWQSLWGPTAWCSEGLTIVALLKISWFAGFQPIKPQKTSCPGAWSSHGLHWESLNRPSVHVVLIFFLFFFSCHTVLCHINYGALRSTCLLHIFHLLHWASDTSYLTHYSKAKLLYLSSTDGLNGINNS